MRGHVAPTSLDHVVYLLAGGKNKRTQFPIAKTERDWICKPEGWLKGISKAARDEIESLQPYKRGDRARLHPLAVLNDLNNTDKHRTIHPSWTTFKDKPPEMDVQFLDPAPDARVEVTYRPKPGSPLEHGAVILRMILSGNPEPNVKMEGKLDLDVLLSERRVQYSDLVRITAAVRDAVERLAPFIPWKCAGVTALTTTRSGGGIRRRGVPIRASPRRSGVRSGIRAAS